jgi:hypothetical protein
MSGKIEKIEGDLVWGVSAIAREIGLSPRQTHYQLTNGLLPAGQQGERWVASRRALGEHFQRLTGQRKKSA